MTNEVKNVPKLRFQRFEDEWKKKRLKDIVEPLKGNSGENKNLPVLTISAKKGWLNQKERFSQVIAGNSLSKYNELKKGDLSYNKGNSKVALYGIVYKLGFDNALVPNVYKSFRPKPNNVSDFLEKYFHTKILDRQLRRVITSTARMDGLLNISDYDFYNMSLNIPVNNEQKKIGDFFSKLDQQIELEEQKLEKLEEQKKGYMQIIFLQQLRFKDENGNDYPEWRKIELGNLGTTFTGLSGKTKEDFGHGNAKFITYMNVFKNTIAELEMTKKVDVKDNERQSKVEYKDILFTTSSETPNEAGMSSIWLYKSENMYLNSFCFGFKVNYKDIEPIYLTRYLRSENMRKKITVLSQGSTRFNISKREMMKLTINFPVIEEQTKIVKFLDIAERRIGEQNKKLEQLKHRKKGFLQKMFV
ncbi:restriction endonuclease subunit S [Staphylococcus equorum]